MKVEFRNVGRDKLCWVEEMPDGDLEHARLLISIRKHKALRSRDVEVGDMDSATGWHPIYAGMQLVGSMRVLEDGP